MQTETLAEIMRQHPFVAGMAERHVETLSGCAANVTFAEGEYLLREGQLANAFYLIRAGRVALEIDVNARGPLRIQTVGPGEILGWSWFISPYRWHFDGVAVAPVRAIALDGECLRGKCESDHEFGYDILKHLSQIMERRLEATRMQLLDLYGSTAGAGGIR